MKLKEEKSQLEVKLKELIVSYKIFQDELKVKNDEINKLMSLVKEENDVKHTHKTHITSLRNILSELQDDYTHRQTKGYTRRNSSIVLNDIEKKAEMNYNNIAIKNFEIEVESKKIEEEIERITEENESLNKKIRLLKQNLPDKLISTQRVSYSSDDEERIRTLRSQQRDYQAVIEKLRLDVKLLSNQRREKELKGEDEEEATAIKDTTRPCAKCFIF